MSHQSLEQRKCRASSAVCPIVSVHSCFELESRWGGKASSRNSKLLHQPILNKVVSEMLELAFQSHLFHCYCWCALLLLTILFRVRGGGAELRNSNLPGEFSTLNLNWISWLREFHHIYTVILQVLGIRFGALYKQLPRPPSPHQIGLLIKTFHANI